MATIGIPDTRSDEEKGIGARTSLKDTPAARERARSDYIEQQTRTPFTADSDGLSLAETPYSLTAPGGTLSLEAITQARIKLMEKRRELVARGAFETASGGVVLTDAGGPTSVRPGEARPPQANLAAASMLLNQNGLITNMPIAKATPPAAIPSKGAGGQAAPVEPPPLAPQEQERIVQERRAVQGRTAPAGSFKSGAAMKANQRLSLVTGTPTVYDPESVLSRVADAAAGGSSKVSAADIDDAIEQLSASTPKFVNEQRDVAETLKDFKRLKAESVQAGRTLARSAEASLDPTDPTVSAKTWRDRVFELAETLPEQQRQAAIDTALQQVPESVQRSMQVEVQAEAAGASEAARQAAAAEALRKQASDDEQDAYARSTAAGLEPPSGLAWPDTIEELRTDPDRAEDYKYFLNAQANGDALYNPDMTRTQKPKPKTPAPTMTAAGLVPAARLEESLAKAAAVPPSSKADEIVPINNRNTIATEIYDLASAGTDPEEALTQVTTKRYEELKARGASPASSVESYRDAVRLVSMPKVLELNAARRTEESRQQAEAQQAQAKTSLGADGQRQDVADLIVPQITGLDPVKAGETALGQAVAVVAGKLGVAVEDLAMVGEVKAAVDSIVDKSLVGREASIQAETEKVQATYGPVFKQVVNSTGDEVLARQVAVTSAKYTTDANQPIRVSNDEAGETITAINALPKEERDRLLSIARENDPTFRTHQFFSDPAAALESAGIYNVHTPQIALEMASSEDLKPLLQTVQKLHETTPRTLKQRDVEYVNPAYVQLNASVGDLQRYIALDNQMSGASIGEGGRVVVSGKSDPTIMDGLEILKAAASQRDKDNNLLPLAESVDMPVATRRLFGTSRTYKDKGVDVPEIYAAAVKKAQSDDIIGPMLQSENLLIRQKGMLMAVQKEMGLVKNTINYGLNSANNILMEGYVGGLQGVGGLPVAGSDAVPTGVLIEAAVDDGLAAAGRGDESVRGSHLQSLQDAHLAFRETAGGYIPLLEETGFDAAQYKQIDAAFTDARRRLGDENAYGGFGAEGAARQLASELLAGRDVPQGWTSAEGFRRPVFLPGADLQRRVNAAENDRLKELSKLLPKASIPAGVRALNTDLKRGQFKDALVAAEVARGRTPAEASDMINRQLSVARDSVVESFVSDVKGKFAKQTAKGFRVQAQDIEANAAADSLYANK